MKKIFWSQRAICDLGWAQTLSEGGVCWGGGGGGGGGKLLYHSNSGGKGVGLLIYWDLDTSQGYKWGWGGHMGYRVPWSVVVACSPGHGPIGHSSAAKYRVN